VLNGIKKYIFEQRTKLNGKEWKEIIERGQFKVNPQKILN
jgi:hypothetical protein